ncbi:hypothetical protein [Nostocoides australiense]
MWFTDVEPVAAAGFAQASWE